MSKKEKLYPNTVNGIYRYEYVMINGIEQFIQVRGRDKSNPLMLVLHGGPGGSLAGVCHLMQSLWEETFTVVNWDQRNAGKTYLANQDKAEEIAKTGSMADYMQDIDEIIKYLHTIYDFEKLVLLGFSWGSVIGAEYVKTHPENILKYVAVGQVVNYEEGIHITCNDIKNAAEQKNKQEDMAEIDGLLDKLSAEFELMKKLEMPKEYMRDIQRMSMLGAKYLIKHGKSLPIFGILNSPFMNFNEKKMLFSADMRLFAGTYKTILEYSFRDNMHFQVPVIFVNGDEDISCPVKLMEMCYDAIQAPNKELIIMKDTSHMCFFDQPEAFHNILVEKIL